MGHPHSGRWVTDTMLQTCTVCVFQMKQQTHQGGGTCPSKGWGGTQLCLTRGSPLCPHPAPTHHLH